MATKKPTTKKSTKTSKDRFDSREGTDSAKINAALTTKPQSIEDLAKTTGLNTSRIRNHMKWLLDRDHISKTDNGYKAKSKPKTSK